DHGRADRSDDPQRLAAQADRDRIRGDRVRGQRAAQAVQGDADPDEAVRGDGQARKAAADTRDADVTLWRWDGPGPTLRACRKRGGGAGAARQGPLVLERPLPSGIANGLTRYSPPPGPGRCPSRASSGYTSVLPAHIFHEGTSHVGCTYPPAAHRQNEGPDV